MHGKILIKRSAVLLIILFLVGIFFNVSIPKVNAFWTVSINPPNRVAEPGGATQYTISISGANPQLIQLIYSPPEPDITVSFSPSSGTAPFTSTMNVQINPTKPTGTYTLHVSAYPQGDPYPGPTTQDVTVTLDVVTPVPMPTSPGFDFTITLSPPLLEVERGDTAHYHIHLSYSDPSFSGTVINLQVPPIGSGINWHSTPSGDLDISTSPSTSPGTYHVEVIGEAYSVVHQAAANLVVLEGPGEEPLPEEPPPEELPPEETFPDDHPNEEDEQRQLDEEQRMREEEEQRQREEEEHQQQEEEQMMREEEEQRQREEELNIQGEESERRLQTYLIIGVLAVIAIILVIALMRRRSSSQQPQASTRYCVNCGEPLTPGKTFCAACGEKVE